MSERVRRRLSRPRASGRACPLPRPHRAARMLVKAWLRRMSSSGAATTRRVLHVQYESVPPSPSPSPAAPGSVSDADDTVFCFCRKARRKERDGEGGGGGGAGGGASAGAGVGGAAGAGGDPKLYLQEALLERKLPDLDLRQLVDLPHGLDLNEWLASHTVALFEHVNLVYGSVSEFCTASACADMAGPGGRGYAWHDERGKKLRLAAPHYVDYVMTYTQRTVNDETLFPTKYAKEFPCGFEGVVRRVVRLLFHVVAHMYAAHFRELALLRLHAHLHLTFAHLTALDRRFALLDHKETEVLRDLEVALRLTDDAEAGADRADRADHAHSASASASPRRSASASASVSASAAAASSAAAAVVTQPLGSA